MSRISRPFGRRACPPAALLLLACLLLTTVGCGTKDPPARQPMSVRVEVVSLTTADAAGARYSGSVKPYRQVDLAFKNGGYVVSLQQAPSGVGPTADVQVGDVVRAGSTLATIRENDYQAKVDQARSQLDAASAGVAQAVSRQEEARASMAQAQAGLGQARSAHTQALAQVAEAREGLRQAEARLDAALAACRATDTSYDRARKLQAVNSITAPDFDAARSSADQANARVQEVQAAIRDCHAKLAQAQAQVASADSRVLQARSAVDGQKASVGTAAGQTASARAGERGARAQLDQAEIALRDCRLVAPIDGVVIARNVEVGALVAPGSVGFTLGDVRWVKIVFAVPDLEVNHVHPGMRLSVRMEALPGRASTGRVSSVSPAADARSRVYNVELALPNPKGAIKSGMIASLDVPGTVRHEREVLVPINAVGRSREHPENYAVKLVETRDGKTVARQREVTLGPAVGNKIAIKDGLRAGDRIIVTGASLVADGEEIRTVTEGAAEPGSSPR